MEDNKLAKEIGSCDDCPIYGKDCKGTVATCNGVYLEPPCTSWSDDILVFEGMYDNCD